MSETRTNLELAADVLIAAMQKGDPSISGADAAVAYFQTVYRGICSIEKQVREEISGNSRPIRRLGETE